ncbi:MAG: zinc-finger-containing protein [Phycisphaerales bacterium]
MTDHVSFREIQRRQRARIDPTCGCGNSCVFTRNTRYGPRHQCRSCGRSSWAYKPLVDQATLDARKRAHFWFDRCWAWGPVGLRLRTRNAMYRWLRKAMGLDADFCHMSVMNQADAERVERLVRQMIQVHTTEGHYQSLERQLEEYMDGTA